MNKIIYICYEMDPDYGKQILKAFKEEQDAKNFCNEEANKYEYLLEYEIIEVE